MSKQKSVRLSLPELLMLRDAMRIGAEDGSLIPQLDNGEIDPAEEERFDRIQRKLNLAISELAKETTHG